MLKKIGIDLNKIDAAQVAKNFALVLFGTFISAAGINTFLVPHKFISSGIVGLSQLISYLTDFPIAAFVLLFNIPVFAIGWRYVGRTFIFGSLVGMLSLSGWLYATAWMSKTGWAPEMILSAIIGGVLSGGGIGFVLRANASQGGTDVIAAAIRRRWSMSIGTISFAFNACIIVALGVVYGLHPALYTILALFCGAVVIDKVLLGLDHSKAVFIISSKPQEIADQITKKLDRGVTFLDGEGAYAGRRCKIIYCVVTLRQLARVKHYVKSADPNAFLTVADVNEVLGRGFKTVPI